MRSKSGVPPDVPAGRACFIAAAPAYVALGRIGFFLGVFHGLIPLDESPVFRITLDGPEAALCLGAPVVVFLRRCPFEVFHCVVRLHFVFVVHLRLAFGVRDERLGDETVY